MTIVSALSSYQSIGEQWRGSATLAASDQAGQSFTPTLGRYELAEKYYANAMYERYDAKEQAIKAWYGLPRQIRPVLSLVKPAIDWWPNTLFGGVWTADGRPASDGQPNLLPYDNDTPDDVRLAMQTAFTWANGAAEIPAWCRKLATIGDGFAEIEVDYEREKAYPVFQHPKHITNIEWNRSGDVIAYTIEIPRQDGKNEQGYLWGKTVTKETVTTLRNGKAYSYVEGEPAEMPNPWGFVPAVWVQHINVGGQHGAGVMDGLYPVIDEVCGAVGATIDFIHKFVKQRVLIETTDTAGMKRVIDSETKPGSTAELASPRAERETQTVQGVPPGTAVHRLIENLGLAEADPHIQRLLTNIEKNVPELTIDEKIAAQRQASFPGAWATAQPMQRRVNHVFINEVTALGKLGQMATSINGEMLRRGGWGRDGRTRTAAQDAFRPFDLGSYDRGELQVSFVTPRLISPLMSELAAEAAAIERLKYPSSLLHVGYSLTDIYGEGNEPERVPGMLEQRQEEREQDAANFNAGRLFA
jgi:hypothetical protein